MSAPDSTFVAVLGLVATQLGRLAQSWNQSRALRRGLRELREAVEGVYRRVGRIEAVLDLTPAPWKQNGTEPPGFDKTNPGHKREGA